MARASLPDSPKSGRIISSLVVAINRRKKKWLSWAREKSNRQRQARLRPTNAPTAVTLEYPVHSSVSPRTYLPTQLLPYLPTYTPTYPPTTHPTQTKSLCLGRLGPRNGSLASHGDRTKSLPCRACRQPRMKRPVYSSVLKPTKSRRQTATLTSALSL